MKDGDIIPLTLTAELQVIEYKSQPIPEGQHFVVPDCNVDLQRLFALAAAITQLHPSILLTGGVERTATISQQVGLNDCPQS